MVLREEGDFAIYSKLAKEEAGVAGLLAYANFKKEEFEFFSEYKEEEITEYIIKAFYKTYNEARINKLLRDANEKFYISLAKANAQTTVSDFQESIEDIQQSIQTLQKRQKYEWVDGILCSLAATLLYTWLALYFKDFIIFLLREFQ